MGKNFSGNNATGKRREGDYYPTPYSLTRLLAAYESFDMMPRDLGEYAQVLEPCHGKEQAIVEILQEPIWGDGPRSSRPFNHIVSYDISEGIDFFDETREFEYIITNPPFSLANKWVLHCKKITTRKFALLLPLSYLHGKERYDSIYRDAEYPLVRVHVFTRYPHLGMPLREDGKHYTGMQVYAWFVWEKGMWQDHPEIRWIDNDEYVVRGE